MTAKTWLMFLFPAVASLLASLAAITNNNIAVVAICALIVGLAGIVPQLPDQFFKKGRSAKPPNAIISDIGTGFATGAFSLIITYFMPQFLFGNAVSDAFHKAGAQMDHYLAEAMTDQLWYAALLCAVPLNALIGATVIANTNRPWLTSLVAAIGFIVASTITSAIITDSAGRMMARPLAVFGAMAGMALALALIYIAGAFARNLIVHRNVKTEQEAGTQPNPN